MGAARGIWGLALFSLWAVLVVGLADWSRGTVIAGGWTHPTNMPTPRAQSTAVADPVSGRIFVAGGYASASFAASNKLEIYDPASNSWNTGSPMPVAARGASAEYVNGKMYVFGGYDSSYISAVQVYDIASNTWSTPFSAFTGWEAGSTASLSGDIYLLGGEVPSGTTSAQNVLFNTVTSSFTPAPNMLTTRQGHEAAALGGRVYVVGGLPSTGGLPLTSVDSFDPVTMTWSTAPADMPTARARFAAGKFGTAMLAAGGSSQYVNMQGPFFTTLEIFDSVANSWSSGPGLPEGLRESAGVVSGSKFYVFGGADALGISTDVYAIQLIPEPAAIAICGGWGAVLVLTRRRKSPSHRAG